ncbi:hypothetical protein HNQ77_002238 [Silvibacterium bohemicum]|uniref:Uncharacterized protein n=1 Tax=Silvibacterium bohemicum TaxID=1577686 RepID=A0A841JSK4_9BACT|nr:hypothetical protein [Silvibacterium bohemicum]
MNASFTTRHDGSVAMHLDTEAAKAVFASVVFAAQFHEDIVPLTEIARRGLCEQESRLNEGEVSCQ